MKELPKLDSYELALLSADTPVGSKWAVYRADRPEFSLLRSDGEPIPRYHPATSFPLVGWVDLVRGKVVTLEGRTRYIDGPVPLARYTQSNEDFEEEIRREARQAKCPTPELQRPWGLVDHLLDQLQSRRRTQEVKTARRKATITQLQEVIARYKSNAARNERVILERDRAQEELTIANNTIAELRAELARKKQ